ncbi:MAG: polyprenol monophosphomannose synthase [Armatimonadota bacterium]|nr:polyprenol monophosphomannose synthase [Armatimonadota bacterium]MCX7776626.1 polyprenol monophosphomannose synthase [Armatimonadota bacterium]MDW8025231.1 polyprenol monophosphomannose synthase [Armatimonadota bacterium]
MDESSIWVVIPTYNEAENIATLIGKIHEFIPQAHVIVVDDNSPDGTAEVVKSLKERDKRVHLILRAGKLGYASAIIAGLRYALMHGADIIVHMDADFSHEPSVIPKLIKVVSEGADAAIGSRYVEGGRVENWALWRRLLSKGANLVARTLLSLNVRDCTSGFRCYSRSGLLRLKPWLAKVEGYGFLTVCTYLARAHSLSIVEVPIRFEDRRHGKSKLSRRVILEAATAVLKLALSRLGLRWLSRDVISCEEVGVSVYPPK